ncbi:MAG: MarR family winged helix-turn-helix transcriptional regulator [Rikenellaceae bacterium]|nr:MarR family winged helix-turn-helix transcriptional regulator [Rikenellaceae bacterium]
MAVKRIIRPDDQLGFLLVQTSLYKQRINNSMLTPMGLTYMQFVVLAGIYELSTQYEEVSQQLLVAERRLDKAMVSSLLKKLIERKLVVRRPNPADSRSWLLGLTPHGEKLAAEARIEAHKLNDEFFADVDQQALREMLKKLLDKKI